MTRAWSVAIVLGVEDKVEPLLFDAVQKTRRLKSASDIPGIFIRAGVYPGEYSKALASKAVAELTEKQKRLFREYGVTGTPSVFINGKYRIENSAFHADSVDAFRDSYVATVKSLLNVTDK
nr:DsbA family protein [Escherichia coli]